MNLDLAGKHAPLGLGEEMLGEVFREGRDSHLGLVAGVDLEVFLRDELLAGGDQHGRHEFEELLRVRRFGGNDFQFPGEQAHKRVFAAYLVDTRLDLPEGDISIFHGGLLSGCMPVVSRFPRVEGHMTFRHSEKCPYKRRFSLWRRLILYQRSDV